jgi:Protein of unknown function (DUF3631)
VADACGVGEVARKIAVELSRGYGENPKVHLLAHIRIIFDTKINEMIRPDKAEPHNHLVNNRSQLSTKSILANLHDMDALWSVWCGEDGRQAPRLLTDGELGKLLRGFKIYSASLWPSPRESGSRSAKGYRRSAFEEAWRHYLNDEPESSTAGAPVQLRLVK